MSDHLSSKTGVWQWIAKGEDHCCWPWVGALYSGGYGRHGRTTAHRALWTQIFGAPHPDLEICHTCDNRRCCNPKHLFAALPKVNAIDKMVKGRVARMHGIANGKSKLTEADVMAIRESTETTRQLAKRYGVSHSNITAIRTRETWTHV